jgi:hypothetical protein
VVVVVFVRCHKRVDKILQNGEQKLRQKPNPFKLLYVARTRPDDAERKIFFSFENLGYFSVSEHHVAAFYRISLTCKTKIGEEKEGIATTIKISALCTLSPQEKATGTESTRNVIILLPQP